MKTILADQATELLLGKSGESGAVEVVFDVAEWQTEYPGGSPMLIVRRPVDTDPYPVQITNREGTVVWTPTAADTAFSGYGMCELRWVFESIVVKSRIWKTITTEALPDGNVPPEPFIPWVNEVLHAADTVKQAVVNPPRIGTNGDWFVWDTEREEYVDSGISSKPSFVVVGTLPATGESGKIYLVANSGTGTNRYDEYIWVEARWEKIGTTEIDLSGYAKKQDIRVFYGTAPGGDSTRTVELAAESSARWDSLKDGDVLFCRFTYTPLEKGLSIYIPRFGTKAIYMQKNLSTGSAAKIEAKQWRYGSVVALTYLEAADCWLTVSDQIAGANYFGSVKISDDYSIGDSQTAASTVALANLDAALYYAKRIANSFTSFTLTDVRTNRSETILAPKTWSAYLTSHLNPLVETAGGMKRLFRQMGTDGVGVTTDGGSPDTLAMLYSNRALTQQVRSTNSVNYSIYYYRSEETE